MTSGSEDASDYVPGEGGELLRDAKGTPITEEHIEQVAREAEEGFTAQRLRAVGRWGRASARGTRQ